MVTNPIFLSGVCLWRKIDYELSRDERCIKYPDLCRERMLRFGECSTRGKAILIIQKTNIT
jgi:hypothetical protein